MVFRPVNESSLKCHGNFRPDIYLINLRLLNTYYMQPFCSSNGERFAIGKMLLAIKNSLSCFEFFSQVSKTTNKVLLRTAHCSKKIAETVEQTLASLLGVYLK